ncbi:MAG: hypothetical protein ABIG95_04475 [Candidatus Woesearchaeota archaeon]
MLSLKSIAKRIRPKKTKPAVDHNKICLEKINSLKSQLTTKPKSYARFFRIFRNYFGKTYKIKYQFSYEELIEEIKRRHISAELKLQIEEFIRELTSMEFGNQEVQPSLENYISKFEQIVTQISEQKHHTQIKASPLAKFISHFLKLFSFPELHPLPKITLPKIVMPKLELPKPQINITSVFEKSRELVAKILPEKSKHHKLDEIYSHFTQGYQAVEKKELKTAMHILGKIHTKCNTLNAEEKKLFKAEIQELENEIKSLEKEQYPPRSNIPAKESAPEETELTLPEPPYPDMYKVEPKVQLEKQEPLASVPETGTQQTSQLVLLPAPQSLTPLTLEICSPVQNPEPIISPVQEQEITAPGGIPQSINTEEEPTLDHLMLSIEEAKTMLSHRNYALAKQKYHQAVQLKDKLKLQGDQSRRIKYALMSISVDLKLAAL